jgi:hypothetical protein
MTRCPSLRASEQPFGGTEMTNLTADRVNAILRDCLFRDDEDTTEMVPAEGIINVFGFHPGRLESHREEIGKMLRELPDPFMQSKGGGWSFLNACDRNDGEQWTGFHKTMDELFVLGIATGQAAYLLDRDTWSAFPGGMPYVVVLDGS